MKPVIALSLACALGQWLPSAKAQGINESSLHPDAARATEAKWQRLAVLEAQTREQAERDAMSEARREVLSIQLSANGWGIIIKPNGAIAFARKLEDDRPPLALFAPPDTVEFPAIRARLRQRLAELAPKKKDQAILAGFQIKGERQITLTPIFDVELWNGIVDAAEQRLETEGTVANFTKAAAQFPLRIAIPPVQKPGR